MPGARACPPAPAPCSKGSRTRASRAAEEASGHAASPHSLSSSCPSPSPLQGWLGSLLARQAGDPKENEGGLPFPAGTGKMRRKEG